MSVRQPFSWNWRIKEKIDRFVVDKTIFNTLKSEFKPEDFTQKQSDKGLEKRGAWEGYGDHEIVERALELVRASASCIEFVNELTAKLPEDSPKSFRRLLENDLAAGYALATAAQIRNPDKDSDEWLMETFDLVINNDMWMMDPRHIILLAKKIIASVKNEK